MPFRHYFGFPLIESGRYVLNDPCYQSRSPSISYAMRMAASERLRGKIKTVSFVTPFDYS